MKKDRTIIKSFGFKTCFPQLKDKNGVNIGLN